jgi:hypothetical protein
MTDLTNPEENRAQQGAAFGGSWEALSDAGRSRCEAMLPDLQAAVVRRGHRRRMQRYATRGAGTLVLLVLAGTVLVKTWPAAGPMRIVEAPAPREPQGVERSSPQILETRPGALERYSVLPRSEPGGQIIDDRQLVAMLADMGRPAGLIRAEGHARLTADVTDAAMAVVTPGTGDPGSQPQDLGNRHRS